MDVERLRKLSWFGCPAQLRHEVWCHLLGYYPPVYSQQLAVVGRKRTEYRNFVEHLYAHVNWDDFLAKNSSFSGVTERADVIAVGNEELATMRQIRKDVPRTSNGIALLSHPQMQMLLERVLFIWAIRHPASGYVQGMNDLFLPFVFVCCADAMVTGADLEKLFKLDESTVASMITKLTADEFRNLEADIYWLGSSFLSSIQDHFTFTQAGTHTMVQRLEKIVTVTDPALAMHLKELNISFAEFAFRWMNCFLLREFSPLQGIRLWDTYLSEEKEFADFHVYFCAVLLRRWSRTLIRSTDFVSVMHFLQNLSTREIDLRELGEMCSQAFLLQQLYQPTLGKIGFSGIASAQFHTN